MVEFYKVIKEFSFPWNYFDSSARGFHVGEILVKNGAEIITVSICSRIYSRHDSALIIQKLQDHTQKMRLV